MGLVERKYAQALYNAALDKFLAQAEPATKTIAAKYPDLITVRPPRANPLLIPGLSPAFRQKHANNVARIAQGDVDLLFMGDSITDFWRSGGKAVFEKYYGSLKTANQIPSWIVEGTALYLAGLDTGITEPMVPSTWGTSPTSPSCESAI